MSLAILAQDLVKILREMFPIPSESDSTLETNEPVKIVLVGHSMARRFALQTSRTSS